MSSCTLNCGVLSFKGPLLSQCKSITLTDAWSIEGHRTSATFDDHGERVVQTNACSHDAVNQLVIKFESIIGSGFYTIKPEMKGAHEVNTKGYLDPSVLTPPGRDVGANSFSSASFGAPVSNNNPLQHILGHHPQQASSAAVLIEMTYLV